MTRSEADESIDAAHRREKELFLLVLVGLAIMMALTGFVLVLSGP